MEEGNAVCGYERGLCFSSTIRKKKLHGTIHSIAEFVNGIAYYGPVGADVYETRDGKLYVIDLHVRWTSSLVLGALRGQFFGEREMGLRCVRLVMMRFEVEREGLEEVMGVGRERGEGGGCGVVRTAWEELGTSCCWRGGVVVGKIGRMCRGDADADGE